MLQSADKHKAFTLRKFPLIESYAETISLRQVRA